MFGIVKYVASALKAQREKEINKKRLWFMGYTFVIDDNFVSYNSPYGKSFRVYKKDIETISLDSAGSGKVKVKLNGKGTLLAEVEIPKGWGEKAQEFIYENLHSENNH